MEKTSSSPVLAAGWVLVLGACGQAPPPPPVPTTTIAPTPLAAAAPTTATVTTASAFGFDHVHESCGSFSAHITNATRTSFLDLYVGVKDLALGAGTHEVSVANEHVQLRITDLEAPHRGEWSCTDVGGGPRNEVTARWEATTGTLRLKLYEPASGGAPYDGPFDRVDIELVDVHVADGAGRERTLNVKFDGLTIGWLPG